MFLISEDPDYGECSSGSPWHKTLGEVTVLEQTKDLFIGLSRIGPDESHEQKFDYTHFSEHISMNVRIITESSSVRCQNRKLIFNLTVSNFSF